MKRTTTIFVSHARRVAILAVAIASVITGGAGAQGMRQIGRGVVAANVVLLPPAASTELDSALAVMLIDRVRGALERKRRDRIRIVPGAQIDEAIRAAGFNLDLVPDATQAEQLAVQLGGFAFSRGRVWREGSPLVEIRLIDLGMSGLSGKVTVRGDPGTPRRFVLETLESLVEPLVDSLDVFLSSGEQVRECYEQIGAGRRGRARDLARRALERYAGNAGAYLCIATAWEGDQQPDSAGAALRQAVALDPGYRLAWDRLIGVCQASGEAACEARSFRGRLAADPDDPNLRGAAARAFEEVGELDSAVVIMHEGLEYATDSMAVYANIEKLCTEEEAWRCILDILPEIAALDSARIGVTYYSLLLGAAQQIGDGSLQVRWAREATQAFPDNDEFWRALGAAYLAGGVFDSATTAYDRAFGIDSNNVHAALSAAQARINTGEADLPTWDVLVAAMNRAEGQIALASGLMVQYGRLVYQLQDWPRTVEVLEAAFEHDPPAGAVPAASFFLGFAYFRMLDDAYRDAQAQQTLSCDVVEEFTRWHERGSRMIDAGAVVQAEAAARVQTGYLQYADLLTQVAAILECGSLPQGPS